MNKSLNKINQTNIYKQFDSDKPKWVEKIIQISRVTKVTKGGKNFNFRAVIAIGDNKGGISIGIAKAKDISSAIKKAKIRAQKTIIQISLTKSSSIPHSIKANFGACNIIMHPAAQGSGVIAGGAVKIIFQVAGIKNIVAKQLGSDNLLNNARATMEGLRKISINNV